MQTHRLVILLILSLIFSSVSFADTKNLNAYYTSKHPKEKTNATTPDLKNAALKTSSSMGLAATNITLINASSNLIYAMIPGTRIYDPVPVRNNLHIYNDYLYDNTYLVLKDPYAATFYNDFVCRRAIVVVYGQPGYYSISVDRELCN